jgi:cAMP-specific phosphodiesterase 4
MSSISFDFTRAALWQAASDIGLALFAMVVMLIVSMNIGSLVDKLVVRPVEQIIGMLRASTGAIVGRLEDCCMTDMAETASGENSAYDELTMLKVALRKLAVLVEIALKQKEEIIETTRFHELELEEQGVIVDLLGARVDGRNGVRGTLTKQVSGLMLKGQVRDTMTIHHLLIDVKEADSWQLDVLSLSQEQAESVVKYVVFDSYVGKQSGARYTRVDVFHGFLAVLLAGYNECPYHNATHAVDVMHTVYRLLCTSNAVEWVPSVSLFGLLIAALAHDLGHQGKTNPFLVETKHAWAIQYNDVSPLENMHCATLFQITQEPEVNIFDQLAPDKYKDVRKVCINTILHTDNVHHFEMVKQMETIYEMNMEACDKQAECRPETLSESYRNSTLSGDPIVFLQLFLHFSDVSNPLKSFPVCEKWAHRVLDEFFEQGDEEKQNGLPVGMLNDRDKISRPGSQHGFINFLVAPLVFATVSIFPSLHVLASQMGRNLEEWRDIWVAEAKPDEEQVSKRDLDVERVKEKAHKLASRCNTQPWAQNAVGARTSLMGVRVSGRAKEHKEVSPTQRTSLRLSLTKATARTAPAALTKAQERKDTE